MSKKLLTEHFSFQLQLCENSDDSSKAKGTIIAKGQFGKADVPTANNRVYRSHLWERELKKLSPRMKLNEIYGELDHPGDGATKLQRVSHLITNAELAEDGKIIGEALILPDTRNGKQLMAILKNGGKVGISSRGFGSVQENESGQDIVQDDFQLLTWDFVADPAANGSYPEFNVEDKNMPKVQMKEINDEKIDIQNIKTESFQESEIEKKEQEKDSQATDDKTDKANEDEIQSKIESLENRMEALVAKIRKEEAEKSVNKLAEMIKSREEEIREEIKSALESDPNIAGAKIALESVKQHLRPFIIGEDISEEIGNREKKIEELKNDLQIKEQQLGEYANVTKELGYKLRVEQRIADYSNKKQIRQNIGDVMRYESLKELDVRLSEILRDVKQEEERKNRQIQNVQEEIKKLQEQNVQLQESYEQTLQIAKKLGIKAYMEKKLSGNPAATRIKKIVESRNLERPEDIDALVEQFQVVKTQGSVLRDKIKSRFKAQEGTKNLVEDQVFKTLPHGDSEEILPGITVEDVKRLS